MTVHTVTVKGWRILRATAGDVEVDILPDKGGDIIALRYRGTNLLWTSPWGLRERAAKSHATNDVERFLESYPGGWQTIFPNGGEGCVDAGIEHSFHGEACLVPWTATVVEDESSRSAIELATRLSSVPVSMVRRVAVTPAGVDAAETALHEGSSGIDVMWSHHPAFGAPFISERTLIECGAEEFVVDPQRDVAAGDLEPGSRSAWPQASTRAGGTADLTVLPGPGARLDRFGYATGFREGLATITNPVMGVRVGLKWDASIFPHAWYWLEAHATQEFPWFGEAYVFAIEPASSIPGHGIRSVREAGESLLHFESSEAKTVELSLMVADV